MNHGKDSNFHRLDTLYLHRETRNAEKRNIQILVIDREVGYVGSPAAMFRNPRLVLPAFTHMLIPHECRVPYRTANSPSTCSC